MSDTRSHEHGSLQPPPQPPRMNRSQPQLATVYAPGAMFTWEGGKGACIAAPVEGAPTIDFSNNSTRREQIFETMTEYCESWLQRGLNINRPVPVYGVELLDGLGAWPPYSVVHRARHPQSRVRPGVVLVNRSRRLA